MADYNKDNHPSRESLTVAQALERRIAAKKELIPKEGFNVVEIDIFESEPGEDISLRAHCATKEEADAIVAAESTKDTPMYVYGPDEIV